MMEFIKREKKFVAVAVLTVGLIFLLQATAVSDLQANAASSLTGARTAWKSWGESVTALHAEVKKAPKVNGEDAENFKVTSLTTRFRLLADDLGDAKTSLLARLEWKTPADFLIEDDGDLKDPSWYQRRFQDRRTQLTKRYGNQQAYAYVREPRLGDPNIDANLDFAAYLSEAEAWAGLRGEKEETGASRGVGRGFSIGRGRGDEPEPDSPEEREQKERQKARAEARLNMVLLSIASRVIEAGREARLDRVSSMTFVRRPAKMQERFQVETQFSSFYRPVCMQLSIEAEESRLMTFLDQLGAIREGAEKGQFIGVESVEITAAEQCLLPQPENQLINATVVLVAWLVDSNLEFNTSNNTNRRGGGSGRYRWGGR